MWEWYEWDSIEAFNEWHEAIKIKLGYPLIGVNQATGEKDFEACLTTEYTNWFLVNEKFIAVVELENAEGLTKSNLTPPKRTTPH
jgi:myosin-crossreactive antigen